MTSNVIKGNCCIESDSGNSFELNRTELDGGRCHADGDLISCSARRAYVSVVR